MKLKIFIFLLFSVSLLSAMVLGCEPHDADTHTGNCSVMLFGKIIPDHPRLLFLPDEEQNIKQLKNNDPLLNDLFGLLKYHADKLLSTPVMKYELREEYSDILVISREQIHRMITLSLAYRLFGNPQYARKAEENLLNVCNYPDWDPKHFLDVAEMTTAVAIGYDWLYPVLPEKSRKTIRTAIKEKALDLAVKEYAAGDHTSWAKRETNWNVVCNTGMILGALAIAEDFPVLAEEIIPAGAGFVPNCLKHYDPDGVCYEGSGYWNYTNSNLAMLLKALNDNLGQDYGISNLPGVSKTAEFYVASVSPGGKMFNFANTSGTAPSKSPLYFYFSRKFNLPEVAEFYRSLLRESVRTPDQCPRWHFFLCIPWYDGAVSSGKTEKTRLQVFRNDYNPILVFNGKPGVKNSVYLIAKGGAPDVAHQQLDVGTFVIETNGIRWTDDLGADRYSLPGFWDYAPGGQRWDYFRNTNFSHNTLTIDGHLQYSRGRGTLLRYITEAAKPFGIIDMSSVYKDQATSVLRGFKLLDDNLVLVQDEVCLCPGIKQIEWSSVTSADVEISGNTAVLKKDGQELYVRIITPSNAVFTTAEAKTFTDQEYPLTGYHLLKATVTGAEGSCQTIRVIMSSDPSAVRTGADPGKLSEWN